MIKCHKKILTIFLIYIMKLENNFRMLIKIVALEKFFVE